MQKSPSKRARYDWRPDLPDHRDHSFAPLKALPKTIPSAVDLSAKMPAVFDQGQLGSCTGNAMAGAFAFAHQGVVVSRLMAYYNARALEGSVRQDAGAQIRDVVKGMAQTGACQEKLWPYVTKKFATKPTVAAYQDAGRHRVSNYQRLTSLDNMLACLASGEPFIFGFSVYESFESEQVAKTGVLNMPARSEQLLGGHAVCAVGYDQKTQRFKIRNSWGADWGQQGYFTMPFNYLESSDLADDFWVVRA